MNTARSLNGKYNVTKKQIASLGGKWDDELAVYVFPDGSIGGFTDIKNGAQERTSAGVSVTHFVGGDIHPDYRIEECY